MILNLQDLAKQGKQNRELLLTERLPTFLIAPCLLDTSFQVHARDDFYLIDLTVKASIKLICQRCMCEFLYPYHNQTQIAVCSSEERAETLIELYECIVSLNGQVILEDLVTDELHLYLPQFHPQLSDCTGEITQILS